MKNEIQVFNFQESEVRTITTPNNEIYFVAVDVCKILDYSNTSDALTRLDEDEVVSNYPIIDKLGREQKTNIITESGFYSLVLGSRKPEAKAFRKWVTSEVLPSIRKTGCYGLDNKEHITKKIQEFEDFKKDILSGRTINYLIKKSKAIENSNLSLYFDKYLVQVPKEKREGLTCTEIAAKINQLTGSNFSLKTVGNKLTEKYEKLQVWQKSINRQIYFVNFL